MKTWWVLQASTTVHVPSAIFILYDFINKVDSFSLGLLPIIQRIECSGRVLESLETIETLKDHLGKVLLEAFIDGM